MTKKVRKREKNKARWRFGDVKVSLLFYFPGSTDFMPKSLLKPLRRLKIPTNEIPKLQDLFFSLLNFSASDEDNT